MYQHIQRLAQTYISANVTNDASTIDASTIDKSTKEEDTVSPSQSPSQSSTRSSHLLSQLLSPNLSLNTSQQGWVNDVVSWGQATCKQHFDSVKSTIYNTTIGHFYTSGVMRHILVEIPDNSKILDVGIGTGYIYSQNSDLIKRKNIYVTGIDTDPGYIKHAKHSMIDADLESHVRLLNCDTYTTSKIDIDLGSFDFVIFSDSYSSISDVYSTITFCERYLNRIGIIIVASALFDKYDENIDWIKQRLIYVSSIDFGNMMIKEDLEQYVEARYSGNIDECFRVISSAKIPGTEYTIKTYIVKWCPDGDIMF